jgi:hypothetical protein
LWSHVDRKNHDREQTECSKHCHTLRRIMARTEVSLADACSSQRLNGRFLFRRSS